MIGGLHEKRGLVPEPPPQGETFIFDLSENDVVFPDYFQSVVAS